MEHQFIKISVEERVALLRVDNPPVNVLSVPVLEELEATLDTLAQNREVTVLIITGVGQNTFIAGADINEIARISKEGREVATKLMIHAHSILNKMENMRKPVLAAVNGYCLGAGLALALACDIRICSDRAHFGQPEINLGIIPGFGGTQRLPRLIGKGAALELLLTGDLITAKEALRIGLVNSVVPNAELLKATTDLAGKIAAKSQVAIQLILESVEQGLRTSLTEGLGIEARNFGEVIETQEGVDAFLQNRQPFFQDR